MANVEQKQRFNVHEIFAGRCPPEETAHPPKASNPEFKERAKAIEREILEVLLNLTAKESLGNVFRFEELTSPEKRQAESIYRQPLKCDPNLVLDFSKIYTPSIRRHALTINILRPDAKEAEEHFVANFNIELRENNVLDIYHREVSPRYRGQHIFPAVISSLKQFANSQTSNLQKPVRLRFECGQPELLARIRDQEFEPKDDEQRERAKKMLSGDTSLFADYSYYLDDDNQWKRESGKLLYCYEGVRERANPEDKQWQKAYRATVFYEPTVNYKQIEQSAAKTIAGINRLNIE
ncbi:MAG: hypothetical protein Q7R81_04445 [Candidatus Peregrinibacteria bacterium]|nr:hypothetical protein [Candidatus Peregrinibacteria bacterium]